MCSVLGDLQRTLGANVRRRRVAQGHSQESFAADVLHCHRTYVGSLERGEQNISLQRVELLAKKLDIEPLSLLEPVSPDPSAADRESSARGT